MWTPADRALVGDYGSGQALTDDQWRMLQSDNIVSAAAESIAAFGIQPTPLVSVSPSWLVQYRRQGRFSSDATA